MPLTPEQIKEMDAISGLAAPVKSTLTPAQIAEMDSITGLSAEEPQKFNVSKGESLARGALQGVTLGTSDEAYGGLRSLTRDISRGIEKGLYGDNMLPPISYKDARDASFQANKAAQEANPKSYLGGEILGTVAGGGLGASTKAGAAAANSIRSGNLAARIIKGGLAGAASGGLYGATTAEPGQRLEGGKLGAEYGGAIGATLPVAGAALGGLAKGTKTAIKGALARSPEEVEALSGALRSAAGGLYNKMREVGAVLNPSSSNGLLATIDAEVAKNKFIPALNPKTSGIIDNLAETIQKNGGTIGLDELDQYRRLLGRVGASEDGVSAGAAKRAIDNIVGSLTNNGLVNGGEEAIQLLKQGRTAYAQASKFDDISDIIVRADGDPNKLKSSLTRFINNKDNTKGWTTEELSALKEAARSGVGEKLLKMGGKFGFDLGNSMSAGNTVGPIVGASAAGLAGGVTSASVVPVLGTVSRQLQKYMARGKAEDVIRAIQSGSVPKEITKLPAKEASDIINKIKLAGTAAATQQPVNISDKVGVK